MYVLMVINDTQTQPLKMHYLLKPVTIAFTKKGDALNDPNTHKNTHMHTQPEIEC